MQSHEHRALRQRRRLEVSTTRGPGGRSTLTQLVSAAVDLADEIGLDGVSLSKAADRLGMTTTAVYGYVDSKAELVALMVDTAVGEPPAITGDDWQQRCRTWVSLLGDRFTDHPWLGDVQSTRMPTQPSTYAWIDALVGAIADQEGLDALRLALLLDSLVRAYASRESGLRDAVPVSWLGDALAARFPRLAATPDRDVSDARLERDLAVDAVSRGVVQPDGLDLMGGDVLFPGDPDYRDAIRPFNGRYRHIEPAAVIRCTSPDDVAHALTAARNRNLPVAVRSGGHSFAGCSTTSGVLLDCGPIDTILVEDGKVVVGAGVCLGDLYSTLAAHQLTLPGGTCPTVAIAGLTLGGGLGILGRRYGLTSDRLIAVDAVLADGTTVTCNNRDHGDLFWTLRGGGTAGFAVVTSFTFDPVPLPTGAINMHASWPIDVAAAVIDAWQRWAPDAPTALAASLKVTVPANLDESASVDLYATWSGEPDDLADGETLMRRFIASLTAPAAPPTNATVARSDFLGALAFWAKLPHAPGNSPHAQGSDSSIAATVPAPAWPQELLYPASQFFDRPLPTDIIDALVIAATTDRRAGERRELDFMPWGGAYNEPAADDTAFVHRFDTVLLKPSVALPLDATPHEQQASARQLRRITEVTAPASTGRGFQNFADPDLADPATAYYGSNLPRMREVKARYDPNGTFHDE